jgi:hypothetical protein
VFLTNCAVEKVWNKAIQRGAFKAIFDSEVELLESGLNETTIKEYRS